MPTTTKNKCPISGDKPIKSHIFSAGLLNSIRKQAGGDFENNQGISRQNKQDLFSKEVDRLLGVYEDRFINLYKNENYGQNKDFQIIIHDFALTMFIKTIFGREIFKSKHMQPYSDKIMRNMALEAYYFLKNNERINFYDRKVYRTCLTNIQGKNTMKLVIDSKNIQLINYYLYYCDIRWIPIIDNCELLLIKLPQFYLFMSVNEYSTDYMNKHVNLFTTDWVINHFSKLIAENANFINHKKPNFLSDNQKILDQINYDDYNVIEYEI